MPSGVCVVDLAIKDTWGGVPEEYAEHMGVPEEYMEHVGGYLRSTWSTWGVPEECVENIRFA